MKQMRRLSIVWGILLVMIVGLLTTFGILFNKKNKLYKDMEDDLEAAAKKYVDQSFLYPKDGKQLKITYTTLKDNGFIDKLEVNKKACDGYVTIKNNELVYKYKGYLKCPEYQTENYKK